MNPLLTSHIPYLNLSFRGKVRDVYDLGDELLLVATDRLSAFDVVFPTPIPDKGEILTQLSLFWFDKMKGLIANHLSSRPVESVFKNKEDISTYAKRSMIVVKTKPLEIESITRGYLAGSGWVDYQKNGSVCGVALPPGLKEADKLPAPIFTPSTKAVAGEHDQNISFEEAQKTVGADRVRQVRDISIRIYTEGRVLSERAGIILADTKFEFGTRGEELLLIDELLTPDSSRFWPKDKYRVGASPPSFDKQFVRDYLLKIGWNKKPPAPELPLEIVEQTTKRYHEAFDCLTGV